MKKTIDKTKRSLAAPWTEDLAKPAPWAQREGKPVPQNSSPTTRTDMNELLQKRLFLGRQIGNGETVTISPTQLSTHLHVLGASGVGKSFFLEGLIKTLIFQGHGVCLIDPHGDLYHRVLDFCAWLHVEHPKEDIARRVIPFDIAESKRFLGFNPLAKNARVMTYQVVALMEAIRKAWGQDSFQETPRLARWLFNTAYALIETELSLIQSKYLLDPKPNPYREAIIQKIKHPDIKAEWEYVASARDKERAELTESTFNRLRMFVMHERIQCILGQRARAIDFSSVVNDGKILLVNLARQNTISEDDQSMLGTLLINDLLAATFARPRGRRTPFFLFIDEFSRFVTKDICEILDGGRKFGLHLVLAHQTLNQLKQKDPEVYYSTLTNARLKSVFGGLSDEDLDRMGKEMFTGEMDPDLIKQEIWHTVFEPKESTRITQAYSESRSEGKGKGVFTHDSLSSGMYIPGSDPLAPPMPVSTSESHGSGTGSSTTFSESYTSGTSRSVVPWYEYHKTTELTSREFMNLEEQLYRKKAQLKKLPSQHYAFLMPEQNVQILKAGTLKGQSELITDRHRQEFLEEAFTHAGCFSTPEEVEQEQQAIERSLIADRPLITLVESSEETQSATKKGRGVTPASKRGSRRKPQPKSKPTIFDNVPFDPNDPNQSGKE